jgi:hypothetical protein
VRGKNSGYGWQGPEDEWSALGSAEYYEYLITEEERAEMERAQRAEDEATFAAAQARLAEMERRLAQLGQDIFGGPLTPGSELQAEAGGFEHG